MSARDYRSSVSRHSESGKVSWFEQILFKIYADFSHGRIIAHSGKKEKLNAKIISIGNITFGGSGKTPFVEYLARHYATRGIKTGIASSGYGGLAREKGALVSDGKSLKSDIESAGDESIMLARNLSDLNVPIFIHMNRIIAAKELIEKFKCQVLILDDAFHFVSIEKDADILLVNALNPLTGQLLREPLSAMKRADCVIVTNRNLVEERVFSSIEKTIRNNNFDGSIFMSEYLPSRVYRSNADGVELVEIPDFKLIPLSGIGNPSGFEHSLRILGLTFDQPIRFDDHHIYTEKDAILINNAISEENAYGLITTSKDLVRLEKIAKIIKGIIFILHSEIHIQDEFMKWLDKKIQL